MNAKYIKMTVPVILFLLLLTSCGKLTNLPQGEFLNSYESPGSSFTLNIYWGYHEEEAEVNWIDEETVVINGRTLNVLKDVYDFREE